MGILFIVTHPPTHTHTRAHTPLRHPPLQTHHCLSVLTAILGGVEDCRTFLAEIASQSVKGNHLGCLTVAKPHCFPFRLLLRVQFVSRFRCSHVIGQLFGFRGDVSIDSNLHVFLVTWGHEGQGVGEDLMTLRSV